MLDRTDDDEYLSNAFQHIRTGGPLASLQAKHSSLCALRRSWTLFDQAVAGRYLLNGPLYYVVVRDAAKTHREAVGRDRRGAELAVDRVASAVEDDSYRSRRDLGFSEWADQWIASIERKLLTVGSYRSTVAHAKETFGGRRVRRLGPEDVGTIQPACSASGAARPRHARNTSGSSARACRRPSPSLRGDEPCPRAPARPTSTAGAKGSRLLRERRTAAPVRPPRRRAYRSVCLIALKTGMRHGELVALRWRDIDLEQAVIRVRRSYTGGQLGTPKNRERRDVDLITDVVEILARDGKPGREPATTSSSPTTRRVPLMQVLLRRHLYPAMAAAQHPKGSGQPTRNAPSTASATPSPSERSKQAPKSHGSPGTSGTPRSKSRPTSTATGNAANANSKPQRWKARFPSERAPGPYSTRLYSVSPLVRSGEKRVDCRAFLVGREGIEPRPWD